MLRDSSIPTSSSPTVRKIGLATLVSLVSFWVPLPFLNFDSHHDGLSLTTIELTKQAIQNGNPVPFNQYGPFWTVPYLAISYFIPSDFLFLGMRIVTVSIYLATSLIMYKLSRLFLTKNFSVFASILFLGAQPFTSDYGSSLVPWPSVVIMPLMPLIAYLMIRKDIPSRSLWKMGISVGAMVPLVILTRVQVGFLLVLTLFFWLLWRRSLSLAASVALGFGLSLILALSTLHALGWLDKALFDQFVFGATYLSADKSTFPKPVITLVSALLCALFLLALDYFKRGFNVFFVVKKPFFFLSVGSIGLISSSYLLLVRKVDFTNSLVLITRRFWIVVCLGVLLYSGVTLLLKLVRKKDFSYIFPRDGQDGLLLSLCVSFQSQIYPLFDQMHFWWGSPLTFIILALVLSRVRENLKIDINRKTLILFAASCLLIVANLIPWISQVSKEKVAMPSEIGKLIYSGSQNSIIQKGEQDFFAKYITPGARVLNLCDDPNIFFKPNTYIPASRFFVFWGEQMSHAEGVLDSFKNSNPDFILTCGLTHAPALRVKQEKLQSELVQTIFPGASPFATLALEPNKVWSIYKPSKS